jgi:hypothetical protein
MGWYDPEEDDVVVVMEAGPNGPEIAIYPGDIYSRQTSEFDEDTLTRMINKERQIYRDTQTRKKGA